MNISELKLKIKNIVADALHDWGVIMVVMLVGLSSFGLGRLSAIEEVRPAVAIQTAQTASAPRTIIQGGLIVASRRGSAYHYPWCPGAETITAENKIWFKNEDAAKIAGYTPAKNCKGLVNE
ncbi:MAG: hypothetical protein AAB947_01755 [Patescibacteria group bacterium]